jgi:hypothetical protein
MAGMGPADVPVLVKHMTIAIFRERLNGPRQERFLRSFGIARARCVTLGYLDPASAVESVGRITLTVEGQKRNRQHVHDSKSLGKNMQFDTLFLEAFGQKKGA